MAIEITCDCGKGYRVSGVKAGKRFKCRDCGTLLQVPNTNDGATDDENDGDDDVEMEPDTEYVPAHHRGGEGSLGVRSPLAIRNGRRHGSGGCSSAAEWSLVSR